MYLTAVINIGNFDYIPCKQYIKNHSKFVKKFIQKASPGLYTLNFTNINYVCLKTNNKKYIFDSINQKFSEQIEPTELISDLLYIFNNSKSKKKLLSILIITLCKSFKWNNDEINNLLEYADYLETNKELKEVIINDIYNNNKSLYNFIIGGAITLPTNNSDSSNIHKSKTVNKDELSNFNQEDLLKLIKSKDLSKPNEKDNKSKKYDKEFISKPNEKLDTTKSIETLPNIEEIQKYAKMLPKNITNIEEMQKYAKMLPKNITNIEEMQKYAKMLPIKNLPNIEQMQKYANMIPKNIPKDTILGVFLSMLFSFIQGIPFIGYPLIIYETIKNIYKGEYSSLLIKPLKFIPGLGFIINLFTIFSKFGKLINLAIS